MKGNIPKPAILTLFLCLVIACASCSRTDPRIVYGYMNLVYYPESINTESSQRSGESQRIAIPVEHFSFFVLCEDDDGLENLSELYLYHDREGLQWLIHNEDWVQHEINGNIWIGTRSIVMHDGGLPRGQFRAVLVNKGGESSERLFTFDGPTESPYAFPYFSITVGRYYISSQYPVNQLICYDQQGNYIQTVQITEHQGNVRDLRISSSARTAALWAEDSEYHISAMTEAISLQ